MSCDICGDGEGVRLYRCKNYDTEICESCLYYVGEEGNNYCDEHGCCHSECKHKEECDCLKTKTKLKEDNDKLILQNKVFEKVVEFFKENEVTCSETIYQTDGVIENAYEFLEKLYDLVESKVLN